MSIGRRRIGCSAAGVSCLIASSALRAGETSYSVTFEDPEGLLDGYKGLIEAHILAAGAAWSEGLAGAGSLEVLVTATDAVPRSTGRSATSFYVETAEGVNIFEQSAATEMRLGTDPNGAAPDILIEINPVYVSDVLWFDPDPTARTTPVPSDKTDAMSVFIHELGHALVFNGWRDGDGNLPDDYQSTFDRWITPESPCALFHGAGAVGVYGGDVPITLGNPNHIGNDDPLPGADLLPDLMNGVVFFNGVRYFVGALGLAICADAGLAQGTVCAGDANGDLMVDFADLNIVLGDYNTSGAPGELAGDFDGDGDVDFADLNVALSAYNTSCRAAGGSLPIGAIRFGPTPVARE